MLKGHVIYLNNGTITYNYISIGIKENTQLLDKKEGYFKEIYLKL